MKPRKDVFTYSPFQDLKVLLEAKSISLPASSGPDPAPDDKGRDSDWEQRLFRDAMEDVKPICRDNCVQRIPPERRPAAIPDKTEDNEVLASLANLLRSGEGFQILDTPEYVEGTGYEVHPEIARRLHQGDFSIQAHVDLHGRKVQDARDVFERFLHWAVLSGKRGVLIIHGRGLSSPAEPVLKSKVVEWLTHGPWRKWVIAYASARLCDGGAGATYVLLRQSPVGKRKPVRGRGSGKSIAFSR
jgi:DNA-nicking Smr family endonuclease